MDPFSFFFGVKPMQTGTTQAMPGLTPTAMFPMGPQMGATNAAATRCTGPGALPAQTMGLSPEMEAALRDVCRALMQMISSLMTGMQCGALGAQGGLQSLLAGDANPTTRGYGGAHHASGRHGGAHYAPGSYGGAHNATGGYGGGGYSTSTLPSGASGSAAVDLAKRYLGRNSITVRGQLPNFTAAGGQTNNCADFVSSCLETTGRLRGHHIEVNDLEKALGQQGWHQVPASKTKPGDVWISPSRGHVQLVATKGATKTIGSNNDRPGHQVISARDNDPRSAVYYTRSK